MVVVGAGSRLRARLASSRLITVVITSEVSNETPNWYYESIRREE